MTVTFDDLGLDALAKNKDLTGLKAARDLILAEGIPGPGGNSMLMHLASSTTDVLRYLIELGEDPTHTNESGETILHVCARHGYAKSLEILVEWKSLIDARNISGATPLMAACEADFGVETLPCIRILVASGADPNPTPVGDNGLMYSLCTGRPWEPEAVRFLANSGTRVSQRNLDGATALTKSLSPDRQVMIPDSSLVLALLDEGAQFDEHSGQFERATRLAIAKDDRVLLERLNTSHGDVLAVRFNGGDSVLHEAYIYDAASVCLSLLEMGIDPNIRNDQDETVARRNNLAPQCATISASFLARKEALTALESISPTPRKPKGVT